MEQPARLIQSSVPPVIIPLHRSSTSPSKDPRYKRPEYWLINLEYRRHGIKEISSKDWGVDLSQPASPSLDCSPVSMDSGICIDATAVSGETWIDKRSDPRLHRPRTPTQRSLINRTPGSKLKKKFEHKLFLNTTLPNLRQTNTTAAIKQSPEVVAIDEDKLVDAALPVDSNGRNDVYLEKVLNNVRRNQASKERSVLKIRSTPPAPLVKKRPQAMSSLPIYTVNRAPGSQLKKKPEKTLSLNNTLPNLVKKSSKSATIRRDTMKRRAPSPAMMNGPQPIKTVDLGRLKSTMEWVEKVTAQENCPLQRPDQRRFKQEVSQSDSQIPVRSSLHVSMSNSVHCPYQSNPTVQPYRGHPGPFQSVPQVYQYFPPVYSVLTPVPYSQHAPFRYCT